VGREHGSKFPFFGISCCNGTQGCSLWIPTNRNQASHNSSNLKSMGLNWVNWIRSPGCAERDPPLAGLRSRF
jgi:hypothetical protein